VTLSSQASTTAIAITAKARVDETTSKVFYTFGADSEGVYRNALVAWEVYGPEEPDQLVLLPERLKPLSVLDKTGGSVEVTFPLTRVGNYRLRAATVDTSGRSTVIWRPFTVSRGTDGRLTMK
jgi:hypothetical protein